MSASRRGAPTVRLTAAGKPGCVLGYILAPAMNSLSSFDNTSLAWVDTPLSVHSAGKAYSMIEAGSNAVPWIWSTVYLKNSLCKFWMDQINGTAFDPDSI